MLKASLISVQSESRMARRQAGTTLAATTGSSPSERRTPRSCRTGRDSRGQQSRWCMIPQMCTFTTHEKMMWCYCCADFKKKSPLKVKPCYYFLSSYLPFSPLCLSTDKRHSKEALFTEPGHSHLSCISWGKELHLDTHQSPSHSTSHSVGRLLIYWNTVHKILQSAVRCNMLWE